MGNIIAPSSAPAGGQATLSFTGGTPGSSVVITVESSLGGEIQSVVIHLDANGEGSVNWAVPDAKPAVALHEPTSASVVVQIT